MYFGVFLEQIEKYKIMSHEHIVQYFMSFVFRLVHRKQVTKQQQQQHQQ